MPEEAAKAAIGRKRIQQIYRYLEAYNQLRNPVKKLINEQPWTLWWNDLPEHTLVKRGIIIAVETTTSALEAGADDDFLLKVGRPLLTPAPPPPVLLLNWLQAGWDRVTGTVEIVPSQKYQDEDANETQILFTNSPERLKALEDWQPVRDTWAQSEKPVRATAALFERFYELHGHIQRESERVELVLGDGILRWKRQDGDIHHPVLLQRLQLEFNPNVPEFTLRETETSIELYTALFSALPDVDGQTIGKCRAELEKQELSSLLGEEANSFLMRLVVSLSAKGELIGAEEPKASLPDPRIGRAPIIFMRQRSLGFATAIEAIREDVAERIDLPKSLLNIVGLEALEFSSEAAVTTPIMGDSQTQDESVLMSKPANREQIQIAQRLETHGCVLVQGPPGTGKTHTIANLLGHLLAQGKTVLVTSHTTKALRVVREKVVASLQPLCVSVLENDSERKTQLENSVSTIVGKRSQGDADMFEAQAVLLDKQRTALLNKIRQTEGQLIEARSDEYRDVVIGGTDYTPSNAARLIREGTGKEDWIPGPLTSGVPLPLSVQEVLDLYATNVSVTTEDEKELSASLPTPESLLIPTDFKRLMAQRQTLLQEDLSLRQDLWSVAVAGQKPEQIDALLTRLLHAVEILRTADSWMLPLIEAGAEGKQGRQSWDELIAAVEEMHTQTLRANSPITQYGPTLAQEQSVAEQGRILDEIVTHLEGGGNLNVFVLLTHPRWKQTINAVRVNEELPRSIEHFRALQTLVQVTQARKDLAGRWERHVVPAGGPPTANMAAPVERTCRQFSATMKNALDWHAGVWEPLKLELEHRGFAWSVFFDEIPVNLTLHGTLMRLRDAVTQTLPAILVAQQKRLQWQNTQQDVDALTRTLDMAAGTGTAHVVEQLRQAVLDSDAEHYRAAYERLKDLFYRSASLQRRRILLGQLEAWAPAWCAAIRNRYSPHNKRELPGTDLEAAWRWRQIQQELERRAAVSLESLQQEQEQFKAQLRDLTAQLIEARAWATQMRRTTLPQRQALGGWLDLTRRIGKGTGKRVPVLQAEARKRMQESCTAVPVWIMPIARVVENFDPRTTRFDVVIIDEASQCDMMGLIALYMAKSVVIVGDHEQVSPDAVGEKANEVESLIKQHLEGIPNNILYDGQMSIYDLARSSFGGTICLTEHFRCVSDIIQFSNHLSYDDRIKPLRDASQVRLLPPTIAYRVAGAYAIRKVNRLEAETVASLLIAATEQPEYAGASFGVISLVGDEQAREIDTLLRTHLAIDEYERRKIVCGNAAHFQGDERTVMFLSVVDASVEDGPLALRQEGARDMFKKRFNVAASRAQDQMWVVHSLQPQTSLKPNDIRRRLIEHAQNPGALARLLEVNEKRAESEFERQVMRQLMTAGYRVIPQWKVGYYRIDMVVEGGGKRLAIECDGDRFHPLESLAADMERQAILERLGWTFARIRGSVFFRNPEAAMQSIFARLQLLEIPPEETPPSSLAAENIEENKLENSVYALRDRVIRRATALRTEWNQVNDLANQLVENDGITS